MSPLLILVLANAAAPTAAQDHGTPAQAEQAAPSDPSCPPEHAAMGHCTPKPAAPTPQQRAPEPARAGSHAGHKVPSPPPPADPHTGHAMQPARTVDPSCPPEHAAMGHCTPKTGSGSPHIAVAPPPAAAMSGPEHAADTVWNSTEMAASRRVLRGEHGDINVAKVLIDRLEWASRKGTDGYTFDGQAWWGRDIDKLWLKSEVEGSFTDGAEDIEAQALWSRAIDPWFDLQLGLRQDFGPRPDRTYLTAGIQGLAPYWFEVDVAAFLSDKGELSARAEAEYDLRITQRLILQPRVEFDLAAQDVPERRIGSGLGTGEIGLRLRYEIQRQFAPYVGVQYERGFGDTADFRRAAGEETGGWSLLVGLRSWF
jgi:copper resistance protein B